jgi:methylglutaconyl-CoA hydratase
VIDVTINRPEIHNAFNEVVISEITTIFKKLDNIYPNSRAVLLRANGSSFSAGADLTWMKKMINYTREENERDSHKLFEMFEAIYKCPLPVIARINGSAIGGGAGLVSSCDLAYSVSSAKFGFTEVKLGKKYL